MADAGVANKLRQWDLESLIPQFEGNYCHFNILKTAGVPVKTWAWVWLKIEGYVLNIMF